MTGVQTCALPISFTPRYLKREDVDAAYIAEQKEIFTVQTAELDKPDNVKAGIVQGKLNKHLACSISVRKPIARSLRSRTIPPSGPSRFCVSLLLIELF